MSDLSMLTELIGSTGGGTFASQAANKLRECVKATADHNKPSTFTLEFKISPQMGEVQITGKVKTAIPLPIHSNKFFVSDDGDISRNKFNQPELTNESGEKITDKRK